ncbi:MAG: dTDP-4-amino-4,6-dideoxygalactose transaminase [Nitrospinaceae bacterium]
MPYNKPFIAGKELFYISQAVMVDLHLSGNGPFTQRCHAWLENALGTRKALLTHSCTAALEMAALLCEVEPGDEVILPSFTFVSTANAFVLRGAVPVFVDIRGDTLNMDETLVEAAVTPRTRIIVPVHYAGRPCAMDVLLDITRRRELFLVEDAAQGLLTKYQDRYLGTLGHLGCLSFHETKNIISGEGGALLINDERFRQRAEILWEKGTNRSQFFRGEVDKYSWQDLGSSYPPSELVSAFLFAQLELADTIIQTRNRIFNAYHEALTPLAERGCLHLPSSPADSQGNGHIFHVLTRTPEECTGLIRYLKDRNINSVFHYVPLHSSPAGRRYGRVHGSMQVTDDVSRRLARLPLFYEMTEDQFMRVVDAVREYFGKEN